MKLLQVVSNANLLKILCLFVELIEFERRVLVQMKSNNFIALIVVNGNNIFSLTKSFFLILRMKSFNIFKCIENIQNSETNVKNQFHFSQDRSQFKVKTFQNFIILDSILFFLSHFDISISTCLFHSQLINFLLQSDVIYLKYLSLLLTFQFQNIWVF